MTTTEDAQLSRPMALNECFQLAAANVGRPSTLALLAALPSSAQETITEHSILNAITHLLSLYPILKCGIVDGRSKTPYFRVQPDLDASRVLDVRTDAPPAEEALLSELANLGTAFDGSNGPLWRVVFYQGTQPQIGLSIAHLLTDGSGARNLFCDLLKLLKQSGTDAELPPAQEEGTLAPTWDSTADLSLRWTAVMELMWMMLLSKVWALFHSVERVVPAKGTYDLSPTECEVFRLSSQHVQALKEFTKKTGIDTLHPLLKGAVLTSAFLSHDTPLKRRILAANTPINFRDDALGHHRTGGNYASAFWKECVLERTESFVELCKAYGAELALPRTRRRAQEQLNMLSLIPDTHPPKLTFDLEGKSYPRTGPCNFLLDIAEGKSATMIDVGTSNLMRMEATGWEDDEEGKGFKLSAAQSAGVAYAPLIVTVVSSSNGEMALSVSWQTNSLEGGEYPKRFVAHLRGVLERVAEGEVGEGATIEWFR